LVAAILVCLDSFAIKPDPRDFVIESHLNFRYGRTVIVGHCAGNYTAASHLGVSDHDIRA
jgi:hypothetical protein